MKPISEQILFVRSGGGLLGVDLHIGMWLALEQRGIYADVCYGTSAGAIVSAFDALGRSASTACAIVTSLQDADVRLRRPCWKLRLPWINSAMSNTSISALLHRHLGQYQIDRIKPLHVCATRCKDGALVDLRPEMGYSVADIVLASMSICGFFPPMQLSDGIDYSDGGTRAYVPLPPHWASFKQVWIIVASPAPSGYPSRGGILTHLLRNIDYLYQDQVEDVLDRVAGADNVHVLWPHFDIVSGSMHFAHSTIATAYQDAVRKIDSIARKKGWQ